MGGTENNLFNPEYTSGDLSKIAPLVRIGQAISVCIISIIGFSIVISTVLKQALHGLYATNPQLWDRVDEVHRMKIAESLGKIKSGGNEITNLLGFVQSFFFSLLPNVKAVTEFDGDTVDPKTFFTKSLPVACLYMFIGVFIFYGYTTKFGEKVSQFGTEVLDNFFLRVDPIAWAQKIPGKIAKANFSTDGSQLEFDQHVNKVARRAYQAVQTELSDITKEKQPEVAKEVEAWVMQVMSQEPADKCDSAGYDMSFDASCPTGEPDLSRVHNTVSKDGHTYTYAYCTPLSSFDTGSVLPAVESGYLRINLIFKEKAKSENFSNVECIMNGGKLREENSGERLVIELSPGEGASLSTGGSAQGKIGGVPVKITYSGGDIVLTPSGSQKLSSASSKSKVTDIMNVTYRCGQSQNRVRTININGQQGTSISFSATSGGATWSWGSAPEASAGKASSDKNDSDDEDDDEGMDDEDMEDEDSDF